MKLTDYRNHAIDSNCISYTTIGVIDYGAALDLREMCKYPTQV